MIPRVTVYVGAGHDLVHTSRPLTGFCALAARGSVSLRYVVPRGEMAWLAGDPIVVCVDLEGPPPRRVALDLRDGPGVSWPIIDRVDLYLKRAFDRQETADLAPQLGARMRPFGLNYGCRSTSSTVRFFRSAGWALARQGRQGILRVREYLATPGPAAFEQSPETPVAAKVVFQTRLWTSDEVPAAEVEPLNRDRVEMVRALRHAFGDRFVGGLVPTPLAVSRYPDDLTPYSSRYSEYLTLKKRFLISIYTRGVEHSLAFKLGETLAAAQCLVSVPLRYELPTPLVAETNYLSFDTPDQAVAACERLLADPELAARMRRANHAYYRGEVEPAAHMGNVIRAAAG